MTKTAILEKYAPRMTNVLQILHDFQNHNPRNYLSEKDITVIARHLNTTVGSIYGIASYYSMFSLTPRGKHIIRICRSPVCHLAGLTDVFAELIRILKIDIGATTLDKRFTLETSECLGQCDLAPAMTVDNVLYGHLTPQKVRAVIRQYKHSKRPSGRRGR
jgi:NADH:ubiquinone oxidoreductase subunit E